MVGIVGHVEIVSGRGDVPSRFILDVFRLNIVRLGRF